MLRSLTTCLLLPTGVPNLENQLTSADAILLAPAFLLRSISFLAHESSSLALSYHVLIVFHDHVSFNSF